MINLKEYSKRIKAAIDEITISREKNIIIYLSDLIGLINIRLINKGEDSEGIKFPAYSKIGKDGGYKELRRLAGLRVDIRTHSFKGDMLKSLDGYITSNEENITAGEIRSKDNDNQKKLEANSSIVGRNIILANKDEREMVSASNKERISKILKKHL